MATKKPHSAEQKEKDKEHKKKIVSKHKKFILYIKLLNGCKYCDETDPSCLEFHHRNPEEKENKISDLVKYGYSLTTIKKEINKCDCICSNCHSKLHNAEKRGKEFKPKMNKKQNFNVLLNKIDNKGKKNKKLK